MRFGRGGWQKYNAKKAERAGRSFGSQLEAALFDYLCLLEKARQLSSIKQQVSVFLTDARIQYIADFCAVSNGEVCYYEAKGFDTPIWRIKRRLWVHYGPGRLFVYKGSAKKIYLDEEVTPKCSRSMASP